MANPIERFNQLAEDYDEFTATMPNHEKMNEIILEFFNHYGKTHSIQSIADLGCGTATMGRTLIEILQPESYLGLDGARQMLDKARETLGEYEGPTEIEFLHRSFTEWSPEDNFDLVYSSLSIHHLTDQEKWSLFSRIHDCLRPEGLFLYADIFKAESGWEELFKSVHWERRRELGMSEDEVEECWQGHKENDKPATIRDTRKGLDRAGFGDIEILWKNLNRTVWITGA